MAKHLAALSLTALVAMGGAAFASPIAITDPSFESPVASGDTPFGPSDGWTSTKGDVGVFAPANPPFTPVTVPDGSQAGYIQGVGNIIQELSATYQADTLYTLSFYFGNDGFDGQSFSVVDFAGVFLSGGQIANLTPVLFSPGGIGTGNAIPDTGQWSLGTVSFSLASGDPLIGTQIGIQFGLGNSNERADIDDVTLDATCIAGTPACNTGTGGSTGVPEPDTIALLLAGLAGLGVVTRRRRRA